MAPTKTSVEWETSKPQSVRMLVWETDDVFEDTRERRGTFGEIFNEIFTKAGKECDPEIEVETMRKFVVETEGGQLPQIEDLDGVDGVILTGSKYDAHGNEEWIVKLVELIQKAWETKPNIKFSGVCFGHQLLCRALGSTVEPTLGEKWELSHTKIDLSTVGEQLMGQQHSVHLHQMHQDHVVNAPSSRTTSLLKESDRVHVWGSSERTPIQGLYIRERLFTTQGHIGYDRRMVEKHIQHRVEAGLVTDTIEADEAQEKAHFDHDGVLVAGAILRFFHGDAKHIN